MNLDSSKGCGPDSIPEVQGAQDSGIPEISGIVMGFFVSQWIP